MAKIKLDESAFNIFVSLFANAIKGEDKDSPNMIPTLLKKSWNFQELYMMGLEFR